MPRVALDREIVSKLSPVHHDAHPEIAQYLRRVRTRAVRAAVVHGGLAGVGAAAVWTVLAAWTAGPVSAPWWSAMAWLGAVAVWGTVAAIVGRLRELHDPVLAVRLVDAAVPGLGSCARSAVQLSTAHDAIGSSQLIAAHARQTQRALDRLPLDRVVPKRLAHDRAVWLSIAALLACLAVGAMSTRVQFGLAALLHPAILDADGVRRAAVVQRLSAELRLPTQLGGLVQQLEVVDVLRVPRGTVVEITLLPRVRAQTAALTLATNQQPLQASDDGTFRGTFVARESARLAVEVVVDGERLLDRTTRQLEILADDAPMVSIEAPLNGATVRPDDGFELRYSARDDTGLSAIDLVFRTAGTERRKRLWTRSSSAPTRDLEQSTYVLVADLLARPGDRVALWLEASDVQAVGAAQVGHSPVVHIDIASDADDMQHAAVALRSLLDQLITVLADRLEAPPPTAATEALARSAKILASTDVLLSRFDRALLDGAAPKALTSVDLEALRTMRTRHRRLLAADQAVHKPSLASHAARKATDSRSVEALESDALFVSDVLGRAHLSEVEALAQELTQLRSQLADLVERIAKADDPDARQELVAAIDRAKARLGRLMQSLSRMADHVPGEFVNADAMRDSTASAHLAKLQDALQRDDLTGAQDQIDALSRDVEQLQAALRDGMLSFTEARFGPRDRALDGARNELAELAHQQQALVERSGDVVRSAAERIRQDRQATTSPELSAKAVAAQKSVDQIQSDGLPTGERQSLGRLAQHVADSATALRTGDTAEAQRMADLAADTADELSFGLDIARQMFPGARGEIAQNAERMRRAQHAIDSLRSSLKKAQPDVAQAMTGQDIAQLRGDAVPQATLRESAGRLADTLDRGDGQDSLHGEGARRIREAGSAMQRAEQALRKGHPDAVEHQMAAREALDEAQRAMQPNRGKRGQSRGDRQQGDERGEGTQGNVRLPGAPSDSASELRQRLLDGMRDARPAGLESAVERYYRELLE